MKEKKHTCQNREIVEVPQRSRCWGKRKLTAKTFCKHLKAAQRAFCLSHNTCDFKIRHFITMDVSLKTISALDIRHRVGGQIKELRLAWLTFIKKLDYDWHSWLKTWLWLWADININQISTGLRQQSTEVNLVLIFCDVDCRLELEGKCIRLQRGQLKKKREYRCVWWVLNSLRVDLNFNTQANKPWCASVPASASLRLMSNEVMWLFETDKRCITITITDENLSDETQWWQMK